MGQQRKQKRRKKGGWGGGEAKTETANGPGRITIRAGKKEESNLKNGPEIPGRLKN